MNAHTNHIHRRTRPNPFFTLEARELLAEGNTRGAIEICKQGLIYFPDSITGYALLAQAYIANEEHERAHSVLKDGYRRTGAPRLEYLRALLAGEPAEEIPLHTANGDLHNHDEQNAVEALEVAKLAGETIGNDDAPLPENGSIAEQPTDSAPDAVMDEPEVDPNEDIAHEPENTVDAPPEQYYHTELDDDAEDTPPAYTAGYEKREPPTTVPMMDSRIHRHGALSLHTGKNITRLRSANLRLIPGLEFAPLRHEDTTPRKTIGQLINETMPASPTVATAKGHEPGAIPKAETTPPSPHQPAQQQNVYTLTPTALKPEQNSDVPGNVAVETDEEGLTPLERLARRLEDARIPAVEEDTRNAPGSFPPSIISETFAGILVSQKAYAEAMKAYQTLARIKPERRAFFEQKIAEMQELIRSTSQ